MPSITNCRSIPDSIPISRFFTYHYSLQLYYLIELEVTRFHQDQVFVTTLMKEEKELGLKATVTQAEIDDCLERAEEIRKKIEDTERQ